jgi:hypothetical protein
VELEHAIKTQRNPTPSVTTWSVSNIVRRIDRDGNVIAGHGRLLAACELGMTEVPTLCLDHLTPAQVRAFRAQNQMLKGSYRSVLKIL